MRRCPVSLPQPSHPPEPPAHSHVRKRVLAEGPSGKSSLFLPLGFFFVLVVLQLEPPRLQMPQSLERVRVTGRPRRAPVCRAGHVHHGQVSELTAEVSGPSHLSPQKSPCRPAPGPVSKGRDAAVPLP